MICYGKLKDKDKCPQQEHDDTIVWLGGPQRYTLVYTSSGGACFASKMVRVELDPTNTLVTVQQLRKAIAKRKPKYSLANYHLRYNGRMVRNGARLAFRFVTSGPC